MLDALGLTQRQGAIIGRDKMGAALRKPGANVTFSIITQCGGRHAVFAGLSHFYIETTRNANIAAPTIAGWLYFLRKSEEDKSNLMRKS